MRWTYDSKVDVLYVYLTEAGSAFGVSCRQKALDEDTIADFDAEGRLLGIEILDISNL